ncbi:unnamed protein product [Hyaloperonospora brassicae]|uniref:HECT domain-containing protein n=1 Tax=Hyaloperonospora brassicae TaxID=162125 RepID=A0AAV0ULX3_HYABA|nr:unnamed protein product [Hyaloperonospora brassicae]
MDMRSKAYPPLPDGNRLRLVLPRIGDLRFRSQLPAYFARCLYIHADPRRRFWYARFQLRRKFIVMSTKGDLYVKNSVTTFTMSDLPNENVLSMPRVARGDPVKVLDLVQCSRSEGQHWELVFTRWRNGMETWLPLEVLRLLAPHLLQEFYVNSINSWAFHDRLQPGNSSAYQTEVELWLFHSEFQEFYKKLRQTRASGGALMPKSQQQAVQTSHQARVKMERLTGSVQTSRAPQQALHVPHATDPLTLPRAARKPLEASMAEYEKRRLARERQEKFDQIRQNQHQQLQRQLHLAEQLELQRKQSAECERRLVIERLQQQERNHSRGLCRETSHEEPRCERQRGEATSLQEPSPIRQHPQEAATGMDLRHNIGKAGAAVYTLHQPKEKIAASTRTTGGDDGYVPPGASRGSDANANSEASECSMVNMPRKRRRKRLLYSQVGVDDDDVDDFPDLSQPPSRFCPQNVTPTSSKDDCSDNQVVQENKKQRTSLRSSGAEGEGAANCCSPGSTAVRTINGDDNATDNVCDDVDDNEDVDTGPLIIIGKIQCVCGATSVGHYRGQWLQCWNMECGIWEHADCVGLLTGCDKQLPLKHLCARCDAEAYLTRRADASQRILDWLFQCCDSKNVKKLMDLLKDNIGAANIPSGWKNVRFENRTLAMHAAHNGLTECLSYLISERKVDIFATDLHSRNALHFAAQGGSIDCCRLLFQHDRRLLLHPDLRGRTPFHCMLQSSKVNILCVSLMQEDKALIGMGDFDCNFPIHYACQAVNRSTVRICQLIFAAQPSMLQEKSGKGLYPLMILCKSASTGSSNSTRRDAGCASEVVESAKDIVSLMLDIDVFGDCLNEQAPNGWSLLHFAAASGNHELITYLCNIELLDVNRAAKGSDQTALHIAAHENRSLSVRALLLERFDVMAKDSNGWIPLLYTEDVACIQELMHYKLTKQLSRLHRMLGKYRQRELIHRWQRLVARDPVCFDILNDWCRSDNGRIERMEGILLSKPFLLRLDNKIKHVQTNIIPSVKKVSGPCQIGFAKGISGIKEPSEGQKKLAFVFSRRDRCFWKQFVGMAVMLEPEDFRLPILFSTESSGGKSQDPVNCIKMFLIRLAADLLEKVPGILVCGSSNATQQVVMSSDKHELTAQLLDFYLLGELTAHFVLFGVSLSGALEFAPAFLRCIACKGKYRLAIDEPWETAGRSFAAGFDAVLPATLDTFHADDLRVLFNGSQTSFNALQIDWTSAVDWEIRSSEAMGDKGADSTAAWFSRLTNELVEEEQQLLLLFMAGTFQLVKDRFFGSRSETGRITIAICFENNDVIDHDAILPAMEHDPDVLRLPPYSCYVAFKKGMLIAIRHTDHAFLPE